jgi:hypothetical protein
MPMTRLANTALDRVAPEFDAVARIVAAYGETDLLCYRADGPRNSSPAGRGWDPLLDWAAERFGARLVPTTGVVPVAQPAEALARLSAAVGGFRPWRLTALHELVTALTGSLVVGLALASGRRPRRRPGTSPASTRTGRSRNGAATRGRGRGCAAEGGIPRGVPVRRPPDRRNPLNAKCLRLTEMRRPTIVQLLDSSAAGVDLMAEIRANPQIVGITPAQSPLVAPAATT